MILLVVNSLESPRHFGGHFFWPNSTSYEFSLIQTKNAWWIIRKSKQFVTVFHYRIQVIVKSFHFLHNHRYKNRPPFPGVTSIGCNLQQQSHLHFLSIFRLACDYRVVIASKGGIHHLGTTIKGKRKVTMTMKQYWLRLPLPLPFLHFYSREQPAFSTKRERSNLIQSPLTDTLLHARESQLR